MIVDRLPTGGRRDLWHNGRSMFRGLVIRLVLISVGISLPTRTG